MGVNNNKESSESGENSRLVAFRYAPFVGAVRCIVLAALTPPNLAQQFGSTTCRGIGVIIALVFVVAGVVPFAVWRPQRRLIDNFFAVVLCGIGALVVLLSLSDGAWASDSSETLIHIATVAAVLGLILNVVAAVQERRAVKWTVRRMAAAALMTAV
jgi:hypothetical protein